MTNEQQIEKKLPLWHVHRHLYNWVIHFADTKHGPTALFCLSFAESSFFPVPPDVLLAPLTLGAPKKWLRFALACSIASVLGGIFGYCIGMFLWAGVGDFFHDNVPGFSRDSVVMADGSELHGTLDVKCVETNFPSTRVTPVYPLKMTEMEQGPVVLNEADVKEVEIHAFTTVGALYNEQDWKIVSIAGFTPLPYKVITITAGVFNINFLIFCIASALSRSARFFIVAGLFGWKGEAAKPFIDKYFNWLCLLFVLLLIGGFAVLKFLH